MCNIYTIDGIGLWSFFPQLNTSVKLLAERPGEKFDIEYGMMVNYARINMSVLRASECVLGEQEY